MKRMVNKCIMTGISLLMISLTACSTKETTEVIKDTESVIAQVTVVEELTTEEMEEVADSELTPEAVSEPTVVETGEEATEEALVYEGIDMESTLPGEEWIKTFDGIITVPKVVILNDETGRKQIVEDGDKVTINPDTDYIGVYLPGDAKMESHTKGLRRNVEVPGEHYQLCYLDPEITRERGKQNAAVYVTFNGEEVELPFIIKPE